MAGFAALHAWIYGLLSRNPASSELVLDLAELSPGDRVLDIGCGAGAAVERAARVVGPENAAAIDPTPRFVELTRRRVPGADVRLGTAEALPWQDGSMTVVWTVASLHHWSPRDAGLAEALRVLRRGGRLIVVERLLDRVGHGITHEQQRSISDVLRGCGAVMVRTSEHRVGRRTYAALVATA